MYKSYDKVDVPDIISATGTGNNSAGFYTPNQRISRMSMVPSPSDNSRLSYDVETRPKNIALYIYIKVN